MEAVNIRVHVVTRLAEEIIKSIDELSKEYGEVTLGEVIHAFGYYLFDSGMVVQRDEIISEIKAGRGMFIGGGKGG